MWVLGVVLVYLIELPAKWSRDDARGGWESRLDPLPPVMPAQPAASPMLAR
jgi:hypothetical protein